MPVKIPSDKAPLTIPVDLRGPLPQAPQPITIGVPLPKGTWHNVDRATLRARNGRLIFCQTEPLARWSDGTIRWLLLDFVISGDDTGSAQLELDPGSAECAPRENDPGVQVSTQDDVFIVDTGTVRFHVNRQKIRPMVQVRAAAALKQTLAEMKVVLVDSRGRRREAKVEQSAIETSGPVRTTLLLSGAFSGGRGIRFQCRTCFFGGTGLMRMRFTLHNSNRSRHRGGLWDLGDSGSFLFRELSVELHTQRDTAKGIAWTAEPDRPEETLTEGILEIYQDSSGGDNWQSRNHINRDGRIPCRFRGYRVRTPQGETSGLRASPTISNRDGGLKWAAAVPDFWQQFPKSIEWRETQLSIGLFPSNWDDLHELQGGEQKTHTTWLAFETDGPLSPAPLSWVHSPVRPRLDATWVRKSGVLPFFIEADEVSDLRLKSYLEEALHGPRSCFAQRELIDEYGWRHYGEIYADHEALHFRGPQPVISHYNNQFDIVYGAILQWLRTSDDAWFELFAPLARHVVDIDIYHTQEDRAAYNGGLFWHTDHYLDAATSTHRTYSIWNARDRSDSYGGGPGAEHNYSTGLLNAYYLTGERDFRDAVLGLADWVIAMDDGSRNVLGLIAAEPTGLASVCGAPNAAGPGRGAANSIRSLVDAWCLSHNRKYLAFAETLIRRSIHPFDDVASRDLLNIETRWSYTMFLSSLAGYLAVKHEAGQFDEMYAYGRASLLHYACWMLKHEQPYFDRPEQMEFPTEAWAAQEFRKANVFRLAASHAEGELREKLLERGASLADRAWSDLHQFESRVTARAVAIVLTEGVLDLFFRNAPVAALPAAAESPVFGPPQSFRSQRALVKHRLTTIRGLAIVARNIVNPENWRMGTFRL